MAGTSFEVSKQTAEFLTRLQKTFGVTTNAAVIRKALALASVASRQADADNTVMIGSNDKPAVRVLLAE